MITLHETITCERSAADCYRYLLDFSTCEQWDPGVDRAEKLTPGAVGPGSRFALRLATPGGNTAMEYELLEAEPNRRLRLEGRGERFAAEDDIHFTAEDASTTRIDYQATLRFGGVMSSVDRVLAPWLRHMGRQAVSGLAHALTDPTPPAAPRRATLLADRLILPAMQRFTAHGYRRLPHKGLNQTMDGKTVLVTGPTSGLGLAAASEFARLGARVVLVGRDNARLDRARDQILAFSGAPRDRLISYAAELSLQAEVHAVAREILSFKPRIDVLVNNAGALFAEHGETTEGFERTLAINLLAPWRLTEDLLPALRQSSARVINVASGGMYLQPLKLDDMGFEKELFDGTKAYARCKRALVALTEHWAAQTENRGMQFHAMHPGWAATPGVARSLPAFHRKLEGRLRDARMGADTICWLGSTRALEPGHNGLFWFDREPHPTAVLPKTRVTATRRAALVAWLEEQAPA